MSIYGNPIILGTSNPSGQIPVLSRSAWEALTTAQKRAYELVAVQDSNSGFDRGELYYGGDYVPSSEVIVENNLLISDAASVSESLIDYSDTDASIDNNMISFN